MNKKGLSRISRCGLHQSNVTLAFQLKQRRKKKKQKKDKIEDFRKVSGLRFILLNHLQLANSSKIMKMIEVSELGWVSWLPQRVLEDQLIIDLWTGLEIVWKNQANRRWCCIYLYCKLKLGIFSAVSVITTHFTLLS